MFEIISPQLFALETSLKYILNCQLCLSMKFLSTVCEAFDVAACFSSLPLAKNALHSPSSMYILYEMFDVWADSSGSLLLS